MVHQWMLEMEQRKFVIFNGIIIGVMVAIYLAVKIENRKK
jgi:hypothetical protein